MNYDKNDINIIIDNLIYLKDMLKHDGYSYKDYDCINSACNALEDLISSY